MSNGERTRMAPTSTAQVPHIGSRIGAILRATSGNFLEQFDFFLFGFYASAIGKAFFPSDSETASLLNTFGVFWLGALMRPVGAIVLGAYIDRIGRRKGLIVTLAIMAVGTVVIAICPSYSTIGIAAPVIVLIGRLLQGFSAGVELGGVSVYLSEIATPGNRGFYTSFQSASQQVAIFVAAIVGYVLSEMISPATVSAWGWRIPFFIGCLIIPFIFVLRRTLEETPAFLAMKRHPTASEVFASAVANWRIVILGMMIAILTTTTFYFVTVYTPTFGKNVLKLSTHDALLVTLLVAVTNFIWNPVGGAVFRPHRPQASAADDRRAFLPHGLSGTALAGCGAELRQDAGSRDDVLVLFRRLQRHHARLPGRDRASARAHHLLLAGICIGGGAVRHVHAVCLNLADRPHRRQGFAGLLADVRGNAWHHRHCHRLSWRPDHRGARSRRRLTGIAGRREVVGWAKRSMPAIANTA
ncbi:MFS family permease [Bradyrhizobium sp. USDA 10063]